MVALIEIFKYILVGTQILLAIIAFLLLIVDYACNYNKKARCCSKQNLTVTTLKIFFLLVFLHQTSRVTLNFIPVKVYVQLYSAGNWGKSIQNLLDLLPEILFFMTYALTLFSWIEVYHLTRVMRQMPKRWFQTPVICIIILTIVLLTLILIITLCILFIPQLNDYLIIARIQGIFLAVITGLCTLFFLIVFALIMRTYLKLQRTVGAFFNPALKKMTALAIIYFVMLTYKVAHVLILNDFARTLQKNKKLSSEGYAVIWFLYMLITEQTLLVIVLIITVVTFIESFKRQKQPLDKDEKEEYYKTVMRTKNRSMNAWRYLNDENADEERRSVALGSDPLTIARGSKYYKVEEEAELNSVKTTEDWKRFSVQPKISPVQIQPIQTEVPAATEEQHQAVEETQMSAEQHVEISEQKEQTIERIEPVEHVVHIERLQQPAEEQGELIHPLRETLQEDEYIEEDFGTSLQEGEKVSILGNVELSDQDMF